MKPGRRTQRRHALGGTVFGLRMQPAFLRTARCLSQRTRRSREMACCCGACTDSSLSREVTTPSVQARVEPHPPEALHKYVTNISHSVHNAPGRHETSCCTILPSLSLEALHTSVGTSTASSRGRPYPKGKPSTGKIAPRNLPSIRRRWHASCQPVPALASSPTFGQYSGLDVTTPSHPPTELPALSRESSISSLRSVSASSTLSDSDLLKTPPLLPASALDYPVPELTFGSSDYQSVGLCKGLAIDDTPRGAAYLGYSVACGDRDPTVNMSSALYSQLEPAVPLFSEPPLIPTISSSVLVF